MNIKHLFLNLAIFLTVLNSMRATENCEREYREPVFFGSSYNYIKMGGSLIAVGSSTPVGPAVGVGRRFVSGAKAIDLSLNVAFIDKGYCCALPKIQYLHYFQPEQSTSLYVGGGLAYGIIKNQSKTEKFEGITAEFSVGYEFNRDSPLRLFTQLDVSQGMIPVGAKHKILTPSIAFTCGFGF